MTPRERPLVCHSHEVQAIQAGRQVQIRRVAQAGADHA